MATPFLDAPRNPPQRGRYIRAACPQILCTLPSAYLLSTAIKPSAANFLAAVMTTQLHVLQFSLCERRRPCVHVLFLTAAAVVCACATARCDHGADVHPTSPQTGTILKQNGPSIEAPGASKRISVQNLGGRHFEHPS